MGSLEILWSPIHTDKFIAWGPELLLYEIGPISQDKPVKGSQSSFLTSTTTQAVLLATNSSNRYLKCVDIHPKPESDILLAVGQANGKVSLTSFGVSGVEAVGREFSPNSARQCNSVLWNKSETNILAAAFDKSRTDHAVLLWDALGCSHFDRPIFEYGLAESCNSFAWLHNSTVMAAGINNKSIKLFDHKDPRVSAMTQTKAVYGVCSSIHNRDHLASFFESQICVWDLRNFEKPITTANRQRNVTKILWCPTRNNLLGSLQRDSSEIVLHDLQLTTIGNEEVEPTLLERPILPCPGHKITSFSWHPTIESRLLTISISWNITDYSVLERITLNWFPSSNLIWTHGRKMVKYISDRDAVYNSFHDISVTIKKRAMADYGLKPDLWQNGELAENDALKHLWYWLYTSRNLVEEAIVKSNHYHPGVLSVLNPDKRSDCTNSSWDDPNISSYVKIYRSDDRDAALQLCGWRYEKDLLSLKNFLERLLAEEEYTRAAAIAIFNQKLNYAITILNRGANRKLQPELGIVAMALSGFPGEIWKTHCSQAALKLTDPYLRAAFAFLTAEPEKYDAVLNESKIEVDDRIAFACMFLSDGKLTDFLVKLSDKLTEEGNLAGILLTGTNHDGVKLLQRYLDMTGDVQSVSLLAVRSFPQNLQQEPIVQNWISSYRHLLDSTKLWNQRAHFDIMLNAPTIGEKVPQQLYISCNFCQKSISSTIQGMSRARSGMSRLGPANNKIKMSSCPNCRKPLPRCAICLVHIGTPSRLIENKTADLDSWFTWCQSCRHGGHTDHIQHWFAAHSECPVTGCVCRCMGLDGSCNPVPS